MKVTFKTVKQETFHLELAADTKIADVKARVEAERGEAFAAATLLIISSGKILKDDTTLLDNKVTGAGFLVVMTQPKPKPKAGETSSAPAPAQSAPQTAPTPAPAGAASTAPQPAVTETPAAAPATAPGVPSAPTQTAGSGDPYVNTASQLATGSALENHINSLCEMGFPREEVQRAMRAAFNNPDRAVEYLTNGIPASAAQAAAAPTSPGQGGADGSGSPGPNAGAGGAGPNAQPLDMFAPQPAGGQGSGGGGSGGGPLDFLRSNPQFQGLRNIVRSNPQILQPMLQELAKQNPQLLQLINTHQMEFLRLLNEPSGGTGGTPDAADLAAQLGAAAQGAGAGQEPVQIQLTPEEAACIERLEGLGFDRMLCIEAFLACDKDESLAANYLLENAGNDADL